ncbi:hypothetical protein D3C72_1798060 [compost metagenome]
MVGCVWAVAGPAIMTTAAEARRRCRRIGNSQKLDGSSVLIARPYDKNQLVKDKLAPEWGDFQTLKASIPAASAALVPSPDGRRWPEGPDEGRWSKSATAAAPGLRRRQT